MPRPDADRDWPIYEVTYRGSRLGFLPNKRWAHQPVWEQFEEIIAVILPVHICWAAAAFWTKNPRTACHSPGFIRGMGHRLSLCPANVNRQSTPLLFQIYRGFFPNLVSISSGRCVDDGRLLGNPQVAARRLCSAVCVEMECAAMQAMCDSGSVGLSVFLSAGTIGSPQ